MNRTSKRVVGAAWAMLACGVGLAAAGSTARFGQSRSAPQPKRADPVPRLIETFNDCVQERFKEVDERLGAARITRVGAPHLFTPETAREISLVADLERERLRVVLYLAGREVLQPRPDSAASSRIFIPERNYSKPMFRGTNLRGGPYMEVIELGVIKGPIRVTPVRRPTAGLEPAPAAFDLWEESRLAMLAFAETESHDFVRDGWRFAARPIRVTDPACLNCHTQKGATLMSAGPHPGNTLQAGDALGVMVYGFKKMP
jgi:hypothetical protein